MDSEQTYVSYPHGGHSVVKAIAIPTSQDNTGVFFSICFCSLLLISQIISTSLFGRKCCNIFVNFIKWGIYYRNSVLFITCFPFAVDYTDVFNNILFMGHNNTSLRNILMVKSEIVFTTLYSLQLSNHIALCNALKLTKYCDINTHSNIHQGPSRSSKENSST